jgi:hypothetical protein
MKKKGYFSWDSSLVEIVSVEQRISKSTEKPYVVVKARMVFFGNMQSSCLKKQASKIYTMVCFKESLFGLFEVGNWHTFEGEISFDWGNTWLKITRLYDDKGNRLLMPDEAREASRLHESLPEAISREPEAYFQKRMGENQTKKAREERTFTEDCDGNRYEEDSLPY